MKKVNQRYMKDEKRGIHGDCWVACIASILEVDIEQLPDPNENHAKDDWPIYYNSVIDKIKELGYEFESCGVSNFSNEENDYVIAVGKSPRNNSNHAVVWRNGIVHDPHPDNTGIHSIIIFEKFIKIK